MSGIVGFAALALALAVAMLSLWGLVTGARRGDPGRRWVGLHGAMAYATLVTVAVAALRVALVYPELRAPDISVGAGGGGEGALLLGLWALALVTAAVAWLRRRREGPAAAYPTAVLLGVSLFVLILLLGPANPFSRGPIG